MLSPIMRQDIYDIEQSISDLGETDKSQEWEWVVENTWDREGALKAKKLSQWAVKRPVKVTWKQVTKWFDLIAAEIPPEHIDW